MHACCSIREKKKPFGIENVYFILCVLFQHQNKPQTIMWSIKLNLHQIDLSVCMYVCATQNMGELKRETRMFCFVLSFAQHIHLLLLFYIFCSRYKVWLFGKMINCTWTVYVYLNKNKSFKSFAIHNLALLHRSMHASHCIVLPKSFVTLDKCIQLSLECISACVCLSFVNFKRKSTSPIIQTENMYNNIQKILPPYIWTRTHYLL